jgi:hypothetical protein
MGTWCGIGARVSNQESVARQSGSPGAAHESLITRGLERGAGAADEVWKYQFMRTSGGF